MLIRPFSDKFPKWTDKSPELTQLLKCFEIIRDAPAGKVLTTSLYLTEAAEDELAIVAALHQRSEHSVDKRYAVRVEQGECEQSGLQVQPHIENKTGIRDVDRKHVNVSGTLDQFIRLMVRIVSEIWKGQDRLRIFTEHQILGQLAVFVKQSSERVEPEAQQRCLHCLSKSPDRFQFCDDVGIVRILGTLNDKTQSVDVVAERPI